MDILVDNAGAHRPARAPAPPAAGLGLDPAEDAPNVDLAELDQDAEASLSHDMWGDFGP